MKILKREIKTKSRQNDTTRIHIKRIINGTNPNSLEELRHPTIENSQNFFKNRE